MSINTFFFKYHVYYSTLNYMPRFSECQARVVDVKNKNKDKGRYNLDGNCLASGKKKIYTSHFLVLPKKTKTDFPSEAI